MKKAVCRARAIKFSQTVAFGIMGVFLSVAGGPASGAAGSPGSGAEKSSCPALAAAEIYAKLKQETLSHNTYTAVYFHSTERGKNHEVWARGRLSGKYIQKPGKWCEKRLSTQSSFPEQAGPGSQECYTASDDLNRILMPGPYRALGIITMFPEDPKSSYLNGENMKTIAVWRWFAKWDQMLDGGKLAARCETRQGRPHWVLTLSRGRIPDLIYHHDEVRIWVDPRLWFPVRVETYVPKDPRPVVVFDFEEVKLDVPLSGKDVTFEGVAPGWSLVSVPGGPRLAGLAAEEPRLQEAPGLDPDRFLAGFDQALAKINDYITDLSLELRYHRLRQYREDRFCFITRGRAFSSLTIHLEANYIQLNSGEGFRTVYDPGRDKLLHVFPAGIYKALGEQTFPLDDPRLFSSLGDNLAGLHFFALRDEIRRRVNSAEKNRIAVAVYREGGGMWLETTSKNLGIPALPTVMRLLLDEKTRLPLRVEYRGYDDPQAFLAVKFSNTKANNGLTPARLWP